MQLATNNQLDELATHIIQYSTADPVRVSLADTMFTLTCMVSPTNCVPEYHHMPFLPEFAFVHGEPCTILQLLWTNVMHFTVSFLFSGITARETISPGVLVHVWSVKPRIENLVCVCVVRVCACACICMCRFFAEDGFLRLVCVCVCVCVWVGVWVCVTRVKFMLDMLLILDIVDFELYSSTCTRILVFKTPCRFNL